MEPTSRKTVIITGGTTGIGKATVIKFAENGYFVVVTSRDARKEMLKMNGGSIVNLASIAGLNGLYATAQYCASKHAVAPGAIKTDILQNAIDAGTYDVSGIEAIHPMNRLGKVEDIAKYACKLLLKL